MGENLSFGEVSFLTFQAVVQVILVCLAGFWAAKSGLLTKSAQKNVSILNVDIFTPALVFSKLAPSLSIKKLIEIIIIPIFYAVSTGISYLISTFVSKYLNLDEAESNFVTAMSVFGNSNSLPVSLTVALAYTLPNLQWDNVEDDDASKIASRGILYLLIFQQIGQVLRWSWGYNTLLRKRAPEELRASYTLDIENNGSGLQKNSINVNTTNAKNNENETLKSGSGSIETERLTSSSNSTNNSITDHLLVGQRDVYEDFEDRFSETNESQFYVAKFFRLIKNFALRFYNAMNPPLWAMFAAVIVASIPPVHDTFFVNDGFIQHTVSQAIKQLGSVSIPLILIVLGSNLYPSHDTPPASRNYKKIVIGSLISRMIIPPLILLPIIAVCVRLFPVSILDDPIFLVVAFVLTISPPAIQLSQICQLNELFEKEMAGVLFWGYVVLTLPTTIGIVSAALEVLQWAIASKA